MRSWSCALKTNEFGNLSVLLSQFTLHWHLIAIIIILLKYWPVRSLNLLIINVFLTVHCPTNHWTPFYYIFDWEIVDSSKDQKWARKVSHFVLPSSPGPMKQLPSDRFILSLFLRPWQYMRHWNSKWPKHFQISKVVFSACMVQSEVKWWLYRIEL